MAKSFIKSVFPVLAVLALASCSKTAEFQHNPDSMLQIASVSGISPFDLTVYIDGEANIDNSEYIDRELLDRKIL